MFLISCAAQADGTKYEFSFSTSQMFIAETDRQDLKDARKVVLPTTSAVFLGEYAWNDKTSSIVSFNLPLVTKRYVVNGALVEEAASNTLSFGQGVKLWGTPFGESSRLSLQFAGMISVIDGYPLQASPSIALRAHLASSDNFTMFIGGLGTYGIKGYVIFYGVGHRF
ncbi:MAG: hypothetical protein OEW08_05510 [Gammaproteobacteria bacterium]|nr:hypothetical protein [Gammaproteobacteria bacterium]